jgi:hypothetical protein
VLRPRLVGKDTEMHDLFVLFGTLGGISMFGILGIILGPSIAALFITIWEIYGKAFEAYLPDVGPLFSSGAQTDSAASPPPKATGGKAHTSATGEQKEAEHTMPIAPTGAPSPPLDPPDAQG